MDAGEEVGVIPSEPQPRPGVGLRAGRGAKLGGDEVAEVLLGGVPTNVLLHRPQHPPVHRRRGRHRSLVSSDWNGGSDGRSAGGKGARVFESPDWASLQEEIELTKGWHFFRWHPKYSTFSESTPRPSLRRSAKLHPYFSNSMVCSVILQQDVALPSHARYSF